MPQDCVVKFLRTDIVPSHLEQAVKDIADHFKVRRPYVPDFCRLIQTSKTWKISNLTTKLQVWSNYFGKVSGRKGIIKLVNRVFLSCKDDDEIAHLRGLMVEALVIACNGGSFILDDNRYGWGAKGKILTEYERKTVRYICPTPRDTCKNHSTIDIGYWDGRSVKLYECKAQPAGIGCKEINYIKKLKRELDMLEISHELYFVCADSRDAIEMKLADWGLGPLYKPLGYKELQDMLPA